jgi:hypothetical protein
MKPTKAQLRALRYVKENGPCIRPLCWHVAKKTQRMHGLIRRDVWRRCHGRGWLDQEKGMSDLTPSGLAALWAFEKKKEEER